MKMIERIWSGVSYKKDTRITEEHYLIGEERYIFQKKEQSNVVTGEFELEFIPTKESIFDSSMNLIALKYDEDYPSGPVGLECNFYEELNKALTEGNAILFKALAKKAELISKMKAEGFLFQSLGHVKSEQIKSFEEYDVDFERGDLMVRNEVYSVVESISKDGMIFKKFIGYEFIHSYSQHDGESNTWGPFEKEDAA